MNAATPRRPRTRLQPVSRIVLDHTDLDYLDECFTSKRDADWVLADPHSPARDRVLAKAWLAAAGLTGITEVNRPPTRPTAIGAAMVAGLLWFTVIGAAVTINWAWSNWPW